MVNFVSHINTKLEIEHYLAENQENWIKGGLDNTQVEIWTDSSGKPCGIRFDKLILSAGQASQLTQQIIASFNLHPEVIAKALKKLKKATYAMTDLPLADYSPHNDLLAWYSVHSAIAKNRECAHFAHAIKHLLALRPGLAVESTEPKITDRPHDLAEQYASLLERAISDANNLDMAEFTKECEVLFPLEIERLLRICKKNTPPSLEQSFCKKSIWDYAIFINDISTIDKLTQILGKEEVSKTLQQEKESPLFFAIAWKKYEFTQALIPAGADINAQIGCEPILHAVVRNGLIDQLQFCLKLPGINLHSTDWLEANVFHKAAQSGNAEILHLLLKDPNLECLKAAKDIYGRTALDIAVGLGADECIRILLNDPAIDPQSLPGYGQTPVDIGQNIINQKLLGYQEIMKAQELRILESKKDVLSPQEYTEQKERIESIAYPCIEGACNGLTMLFQYYLFKEKADEFFAILSLIAKWDGEEKSLTSTAELAGLSGNYRSLDELLAHWSNDVVWFQYSKPDNIFPTFEQAMRSTQLQVVAKDSKDRAQQGHSTRLSFEDFDQFTEWLAIHFHLTGSIVEFGAYQHSVSLKVLPDKHVFYYDSNLPYRVPPINSPEKMTNLILKGKRSVAVGANLQPSENIMVYHMYKEGEDSSYQALAKVPAELLTGSNLNRFSKLHLAVFFNDEKLVQELSEQNPELLNLKDAHGKPPIYYAITRGREKLFKILLACKGIDLSSEDSFISLYDIARMCRQENMALALEAKGIGSSQLLLI